MKIHPNVLPFLLAPVFLLGPLLLHSQAAPRSIKRSPQAEHLMGARANALSHANVPTGGSNSQTRVSALGPSAQAAARLKSRPTSAWLAHYLPEDRYKIAGKIWKYVTTSNDTYFHHADCPLMLRQEAGDVIGFASAYDAKEAGYMADPTCVSEAALDRSFVRNEMRRVQIQPASDADAERQWSTKWNQYLNEMQDWKAGNQAAAQKVAELFSQIQLKWSRGEVPTDNELNALAEARARQQSYLTSVPRQPPPPTSVAQRIKQAGSLGSVMNSYRRR